jgi:type IX secretion system PorP/SprF family membrane protein
MSGLKAIAQADISMATHWYNRANYNPSSIARTDYMYLFSNIREQWIGVDGAPKVFNVQASQYIHQMRSAFGFSLVGEKVGLTYAYNPMVTYAYRISNSNKWSFSMGLSAGVFARTVNGSLFEAETILDPAISYGTHKTMRPDLNVGFEWQSAHLILSMSSTHLFSINKSDQMFLNNNHRYGSVIYKNSDLTILNYHVGVQVVNRKSMTIVEGNVSLRFKNPTGLVGGPRELFDLGLTYRTSSQMTLLFGLNVSQNLRLGYAYDSSFITGYNMNGTHEIMVEFRIPSKASATLTHCDNVDFWYH